MIKKALRLATLIATGIGIVSTSTVAGILATNSGANSELFAANARHYKGEWYCEDALMYESYFVRGETVEYQGATPTKTDYTGEKIYIFSGWDTSGDNVPDVPQFKAYKNFKANATFLSIDASILEKIDWQKLLEILMDKNIDLEALLARLGLSPEDIANLLGLDVLSVTSNVTGPAYLRTESFKDYRKDSSSWSDANYYSTSNISPGSVNPLQYTSNKLSTLKNNALIASYCQEGEYTIKYNKTGNKYPVIAFESENNQNLDSDSYSLTSVGEDKTYVSHGYPLIPCTEETVLAGLLTNYTSDIIKQDEQQYRNYVREQYLNVDEEYKSYFSSLANSIGAQRGNVGQAVTAFTQYLTANFTLDYKHNDFPKKQDPLLYFMQEAKVADPNYFATAMTLFLRSLGYPARYTQGYMAAISEPGVETPVTALQAYSWCEVYVDGIGWMNADGAEYLLVKLFSEYYDLPEEVLEMMDFENKGTSRQLVSIEIGDNTKFDYIGGSDFSKNDIELIATYDDGYTEKVEPCFVTTPDISDYQNYYDKQVTVLYEYLSEIKSATYTIHVEPAKIEKLNVYNSKSYTVVSSVSPYDFSFDGLYNNGKTYYIDPAYVDFDIPNTSEPGDYPIDFTYSEYYSDDPTDYVTVTTTYNLHIDPEPFIVELMPYGYLPSTFYVGESFYFDRYSWYAVRNDGEYTPIEILDEYILNPEVMNTNTPGTYTLQIQPTETCEVYEYNFMVLENSVDYLYAYTNQSVYYLGVDNTYRIDENTFTTYAHYLNGNTNLVNFEDLEFSQTEFYSAGTYDVQISYTEESLSSGSKTVSTNVYITIDANPVIVSIYPYYYLQDTFYVGDEFYFDRSSWEAIYSDGSYESYFYISDEYILNPDVMILDEPGNFTLYIQPSETCEVYEYNFEVKENVIQELYTYTQDYVYYLDSTSDVLTLGSEMLYGYAINSKGYSEPIDLSLVDISQTEFSEPGQYNVDVSYTETYPFSGDVTVSSTLNVNVVFNDHISFFDTMRYYDKYIYVNDEVSPELFSNTVFGSGRTSGETEYIYFDDERLTYDFTSVDNTQYGVYEVPVYFKYDENLEPLTLSYALHVVGISNFKVDYSGVPEVLYVGDEYGPDEIYKWNISAEATYTDGEDYAYDSKYWYDDGYLTAELDGYPFEEMGFYDLIVTLNDTHEVKEDSLPIFVDDIRVKEVNFDLSSVDGKTFFYNENIDFSKVSAEVTLNNGNVFEINSDSEEYKITYDRELISSKPDKYTYTFSTEIYDDVYSEDAEITIIKPVQLLVDDKSIASSYYIGHEFSADEFDISVKYDDNKTVVKLEDFDLVSIAFEEKELKPGINHLRFTFDDGTYSFYVTKEVLLYDLSLNIKLGEAPDYIEQPFFEGQKFDNKYTATVHYNAGVDEKGDAIKICDDVDVTAKTTYSPTTAFKAGINTLTFTDKYYLPSEDTNISLSTKVDFDIYSLVSVEFKDLKTEYFRLDTSMDFKGAKIIGTYRNSKGEETEIKKEIEYEVTNVTGFSCKSLGEYTATVTIKADGKTFYIPVTYKVVEPKAVKVELNTNNCKLETYAGYVTGNTKLSYDISKLTYTITYENGKSETFKYNYTSDNISYNLESPVLNNSSAAGNYTFKLTVNHTSEETLETFKDLPITIKVNANNIYAISLNTAKAKTTFYYGSEFSYSGLVVNALYDVHKIDSSVGVTALNLEDCSFSYNDPLQDGINSIEVSYTDKDDNEFTASYDVTYKEDTVKSWSVSGYPTDVLVGEDIDFSKLSIVGIYESSSSKKITLDYSDITIGGNPSTAEAGTTSFDIIYKGEVIATRTISVLEDHSFDKLVLNDTYFEFEAKDTASYNKQLSDLVVTAKFLDGKPDRVLSSSEYVIEPGKLDVNKAGTYTITVKATIGMETRTQTITVKVTEPKAVSGVVLQDESGNDYSKKNPYQFSVGEKYNPETAFDDMQIKISYNDGDYDYVCLGDETYIEYYNFLEVYPSTVEATEEVQQAKFLVVVLFNGKEVVIKDVVFYYEVVE